MDFFSLLPIIIRLIPKIKEAIASGISFQSALALIDDPDVRAAFEQFGKVLFPNATPGQATVGAVVVSYSPEHTMWVQNALNKLLKPSPNLGADGYYGRLTKAAVELYQKQNGLVPDGWAGDKTKASLTAALAKVAVPV